MVTAPENVAWILNVRGHDTSYSPIPNSRLLINKKGKVDFFATPKKLTKIKKIIEKEVRIHDEKKIEKILNHISRKKIWLDSFSCSLFYKNILGKKNKIIEKIDPIHFFKSIKNSTEIKNMKKSHLTDGIALSKFLLWLKKNF